MGFIGVNQSSDFERTMEVARQYAKLGHSVMIKLVDFWEDSEEHDRLEWEVHVDFGYFLCAKCNKMRDDEVHGCTTYKNENYCNDCVKTFPFLKEMIK